jgi:hypothetical protein
MLHNLLGLFLSELCQRVPLDCLLEVFLAVGADIAFSLLDFELVVRADVRD